MPADFDSDLAKRVIAWFTANEGKLMKIDVGTYDDDREPSERWPLTLTTTIASSLDSKALIEPSIVLASLAERNHWFYLTIAPGRITRAEFGKAEHDSLKLYFDDAACIAMLVAE